jgi:hypothetical protein
MAASNIDCQDCGVPFPDTRTTCPHCGRPSRFPNVMKAHSEPHRAALEACYRAAKDMAQTQGRQVALQAFEKTCAGSQAVFCCRADKLLAVANRNSGIYANYYDLVDLKLGSGTQPGEPDWDVERPMSEILLLGGIQHFKKLHYAALSLNEEGLSHYGECTVELREDMIAHRSSIFEENLGRHFARERSLDTGLRSDWENRGKLSAAKLGDRIVADCPEDRFPEMLLKSTGTGLDDEFVEVQVFGEMTLHTFRRIRVRTPTESGLPVSWKILRSRCENTVTAGKTLVFEEVPV